MLRVLGFRVLGFRVLGFSVFGFRALGFRVFRVRFTRYLAMGLGFRCFARFSSSWTHHTKGHLVS